MKWFIRLILSILILALLYYFRLPIQSQIIHWAIHKFIKPKSFTYQTIEGSLISRLDFHQLKIINSSLIPINSTIACDFLEIYKPYMGSHATLKFHNASIKIDGSEPIRFFGQYSPQTINLRLYSQSNYISPILKLLKINIPLSGFLKSIAQYDLTFTGNAKNLRILGSFSINQYTQKPFLFKNIASSLQLQFSKPELFPDGSIHITHIQMQNKELTLNIDKGSIIFQKDLKQILCHLTARCTLKDLIILIEVNGPIDNPDIQMSSNSNLSQTELALIILTGISWKNTRESIDNEKVNLSVMNDLLSYFFYDKQSDDLKKWFHVDQVNVDINDDQSSIQTKKKIHDSNYLLHESTLTKKDQTHKLGIGFEKKPGTNIEISGEKEINNETQETQENRVLLKLNKSF